MSRNYDNWERLVAAVIKRQEYLQLCHQASRSPSTSSEASSSDFSSSSRLSTDAKLEEKEESGKNPIPKLDLINADAAITFAAGKLGVALIHKVNFLKGVEDQVRWLKDELQSMQCFLKDAAEMQGNNELIRKWIRDVREVAQDAGDAIEIFTHKVDAARKMRDLVRKWAGFSHLNRVGKDIESIRTRLDEITRRRERYEIRNLGEVGTESSSGSKSEMVERRRRMAAHLQKDTFVQGFLKSVKKKKTQPNYYNMELPKLFLRQIKFVEELNNIARVEGKPVPKKLTEWVKKAKALNCQVEVGLEEEEEKDEKSSLK
ncbi:hypothetical protein ACS0TY_005020 [Phlomoides rotata]